MIWQASESSAANSDEDGPRKRIRLDMARPVGESKAQLTIPVARPRSHSPAGDRPTEPAEDSRRVHQDNRLNRGEKDHQRPGTDRHSSTRPDRGRERSRSHDHAHMPTDGGRYDGYPANRRGDRQFFHPSQFLNYDHTGRESGRSDGPDSRGWHSPPDGRRYRPPRREYFPPDGRERHRRQYLHPDNHSYGPGDSDMGEQYGRDEYGRDEYGRDEYGRDEYGRDEFGRDEYGRDEYQGPSY